MRYRVSYLMDEIWERAVETALDGQTDCASIRTLTLDGAVKCVQGRLPPPNLLEKFQNLQHLSLANIGVSSLEQFPRLQNLRELILSDNRIAGNLEHLVEAGLNSLRDLDLSNNRIQYIEDLAPLAELKLVSLDLYECPVTRVKDYRSRVFGLIKSLKYLDKIDVEGNERLESDDEEEDGEEEEEDDPGSGEVEGEERPYRMSNGHNTEHEGVVDVDEDEESDADEEETETLRRNNRSDRGSHHSNGFRVAAAGEDGGGEYGDEEDAEDDDSGEEIYEEEGEDEDVVEVHEIEDSDEEEDGVEDEDDEDDDDDDEDDDDEDEEEEEVDNEEGGCAEPESTGRMTSTEGEIDGHEQGEDDGDEEENNGETGEEDQGVEEDGGEYEDEEEAEEEVLTVSLEYNLVAIALSVDSVVVEDYGAGYLVQPVGQVVEEAGGSDMEPGNENDADAEEEEEVEDEDVPHPPSSSQLKRKRDNNVNEDDEDDEEEDDVIECTKSSKHH
ncbi:hypothetical protein RJ641_011037 [Dillenia turbinata]|uniref:Acidic leucine-rich nuclear phosphoprotein 32-related protein n=1 Tax=Dillenia turbinata TaxID=194707 RepID=A0AAN8UT31_9MAGN